MPKIEVRTRMRPLARNGAELWFEMLLVPRGSGNRKLAVALARAVRNHPQLKPHVKRVVAGSSKVLVVFKPSMGLMKTLLLWNKERIEAAGEDVEGQLALFGGSRLA